jgi:murein L,D-transpeptidase YafK
MATACTVALIGVVTTLGLVGISGATRRQEPAWPPVVAVAEPRVVVLKHAHLLHLFDGERLVRTYPVDLGRSPVGQKQRENDARTPIGRFRVVTKNAESQYHRFLGLDYPDLAAVERGLRLGLISEGQATALRSAHEVGRCPDWSTELGGGIGIHGCRRGSDWTAGCLAMSDEHVEELFAVLRVGDPVEILP